MYVHSSICIKIHLSRPPGNQWHLFITAKQGTEKSPYPIFALSGVLLGCFFFTDFLELSF